MLSVGQGSRPEASRLCKYIVVRVGDSRSQNHAGLILSVLAPPRPVGDDRHRPKPASAIPEVRAWVR